MTSTFLAEEVGEVPVPPHRAAREEDAAHLTSRISMTLMKGLASLVLNRTPDHPSDETAGFQ